jgi:hypothetical protein
VQNAANPASCLDGLHRQTETAQTKQLVQTDEARPDCQASKFDRPAALVIRINYRVVCHSRSIR